MPAIGALVFKKGLFFDKVKQKPNKVKKYIVTLAMVSLLAACGGNASNNNNDSTANNTAAGENAGGTADLSSNPDYQKGLDLIGSSDCLTCHKVNEKLVGPPYEDVANKYA